jgi:hypothetical protein
MVQNIIIFSRNVGNVNTIFAGIAYNNLIWAVIMRVIMIARIRNPLKMKFIKI